MLYDLVGTVDFGDPLCRFLLLLELFLFVFLAFEGDDFIFLATLLVIAFLVDHGDVEA